LDKELDAAVLTIGGARLVSLLRDQDELLSQYAPFVEAILGPGGLDRFLPVAQHAVDPADPGTWSPFVLRERFDGRTPPSLLLAIGMEDEVFSPDSGALYARGLGVPHVSPVVQEVALIPQAGAAPIAGNAEQGTRTVGFFQYDRVTSGDDPPPQPPTHGPSARSNESGEQIRTFFRTWALGGAPEVVDPYVILGTPAKPEAW
jgi:hypothetical protein